MQLVAHFCEKRLNNFKDANPLAHRSLANIE